MEMTFLDATGPEERADIVHALNEQAIFKIMINDVDQCFSVQSLRTPR